MVKLLIISISMLFFMNASSQKLRREFFRIDYFQYPKIILPEEIKTYRVKVVIKDTNPRLDSNKLKQECSFIKLTSLELVEKDEDLLIELFFYPEEFVSNTNDHAGNTIRNYKYNNIIKISNGQGKYLIKGRMNQIPGVSNNFSINTSTKSDFSYNVNLSENVWQLKRALLEMFYGAEKFEKITLLRVKGDDAYEAIGNLAEKYLKSNLLDPRKGEVRDSVLNYIAKFSNILNGKFESNEVKRFYQNAVNINNALLYSLIDEWKKSDSLIATMTDQEFKDFYYTNEEFRKGIVSNTRNYFGIQELIKNVKYEPFVYPNNLNPYYTYANEKITVPGFYIKPSKDTVKCEFFDWENSFKTKTFTVSNDRGNTKRTVRLDEVFLVYGNGTLFRSLNEDHRPSTERSQNHFFAHVLYESDLIFFYITPGSNVYIRNLEEQVYRYIGKMEDDGTIKQSKLKVIISELYPHVKGLEDYLMGIDENKKYTDLKELFTIVAKIEDLNGKQSFDTQLNNILPETLDKSVIKY